MVCFKCFSVGFKVYAMACFNCEGFVPRVKGLRFIYGYECLWLMFLCLTVKS